VEPRVSVVIPTYQHGRYLGRAVASVRAQGRDDLEIVVVDDGSTDETPRVLAELAGPDLRAIRVSHAGRTAARNRGIRESRGEWVAFLDADDRWLPGKLDAQMRALARAGDAAAFTYGGSAMVDDDGEVRSLRPATPACTPATLVWGNQVPTSSVVARRSALTAVGLFDESLPSLSEDWDLWLRLATAGEAVPVEEIVIAERLSRFDDKYSVRDLERATVHLVDRFFGTLAGARADLRALAPLRRRVRSWHLAGLAKSYLRRGRVADFARCGARSVASHPLGCWYLLRPGLHR
jgi:glycosyltransferase involved in cell wall biosynthesis